MGSPLTTEAAGWRTGAFNIGDAPNPLALLFDHQKSIATIAVAFLGLSAGFADKLVQIADFSAAPYLLIAVWVLLGLAIVLILCASMKLQGYLFRPPPNPPGPNDLEKYKLRYNTSAWQTGFAAIFLAAAAACFAVFGGGIVLYPKDKVNAALAASNAMKFATGLPGLASARWRVESVRLDDDASLYNVDLAQEGSAAGYVIAIRKSDGEPLKADRKAEPAADTTCEYDVADIQRRLNARGFGAGKLDGVMGRRTASALRRFQKRHHLPETGAPDTRTLALLGVGKPPRSATARDAARSC